jgi:hypothetical protein
MTMIKNEWFWIYIWQSSYLNYPIVNVWPMMVLNIGLLICMPKLMFKKHFTCSHVTSMLVCKNKKLMYVHV